MVEPRKILLVDDTPLFLELEKRLLEGKGYELDTALSAGEALLKVNVARPSLVLMDQQMPEMDGAECCRLMKSDPSLRDLPVILVTEPTGGEDVRRVLESGCDDFVTKPITDLVLLRKVEAVFDPARRRKSPRMPIELPVEYSDFHGVFTGTAREIGRGGMLIEPSEPVVDAAAGPEAVRETRLQVHFTLPEPFDRRRIQVFGRIVYLRPGRGPHPDMGIEYIALDRESELLIDAMVRGNLEAAGLPRRHADAEQARVVPHNVGRRMEEILDELYRLEAEKQGLVREYRELQDRYQELELENIELARKVLEGENENATLASLYVASYQLHMSLDFGSVLDTITQILVSLIGVERFAILFTSDEGRKLMPGLSYGMPEGSAPELPLSEGAIGECLRARKLYLCEQGQAGDGPLAVIPLAIREDLLGVVAVYGLLGRKESFSRLDQKLFQLLSHHAATAIYCSKAYSESERKRRTFQEFIRMLTH